MSQKDIQKSKRFRNIIVLLLLTFIAILTLGILTRKPSTINRLSDTIGDLSISESSDINRSLREIQEVLNKMQDELEEIRAAQLSNADILIQIQKQDITGEELKQSELTGPALYASYAEEITSTFYPDISVEYVKAIVWHESRYQPDKVNSKTGVKGLMQISPKWHTQRAKNLGVIDLFDPYGNILVGCDILNELTQQHDFNYALNFFAGGYPYADRYKNSTSPFVEQLNDIIHQMENGEIVFGGD